MINPLKSKRLKVELTPYDVGEGNSFVSCPTSKGYYVYGSIEGENIQMEGKDQEEIQKKLFDYCTSAERNHTIKASNFGALALTLKEGGLGKLVKEVKK
ncbi:MAG: hypothetical protein NTZ83_04310 [Candidatus Pacearchaeota archaeon]|nr:hypothetical protein [Candidatus Pacearchaeota archaeon]